MKHIIREKERPWEGDSEDQEAKSDVQGETETQRPVETHSLSHKGQHRPAPHPQLPHTHNEPSHMLPLGLLGVPIPTRRIRALQPLPSRGQHTPCQAARPIALGWPRLQPPGCRKWGSPLGAPGSSQVVELVLGGGSSRGPSSSPTTLSSGVYSSRLTSCSSVHSYECSKAPRTESLSSLLLLGVDSKDPSSAFCASVNMSRCHFMLFTPGKTTQGSYSLFKFSLVNMYRIIHFGVESSDSSAADNTQCSFYRAPP